MYYPCYVEVSYHWNVLAAAYRYRRTTTVPQDNQKNDRSKHFCFVESLSLFYFL